jgi:UDP-N-acetylmuramyl pentapeptide phosphotransferase/UDP-N-acetylglucosamine-1-phosphate transferase
MFGGPLALLAAIIAALASRKIHRRPIVWSVLASTISLGAYAIIDPPVNLWAVQRCAMALMFAVCCALSFLWLQHDAVRAAGR